MGTSKGYIPPTSIPWKQAKLAVSSFRKEPLSNPLLKNAIAAYANARHSSTAVSTSSASKAAKVISNISGFLRASSTSSVENYLRSINRDDLLGKSTEEIFQALLYESTNNCTTAEDRNLCYVISKVLENLEIVSDEDFAQINPEAFLLDFLAEYICSDFDYCFEEQLRKSVSTVEFDAMLNSIHDFIKNTVYSQRNNICTRGVNFHNLRDDIFVQNIIRETYEIFSSMRTEG